MVDLGTAESSELTEVDEEGSELAPRLVCLEGPGNSEMRSLIGCEDSGGLGRPAFRFQLLSCIPIPASYSPVSVPSNPSLACTA